MYNITMPIDESKLIVSWNRYEQSLMKAHLMNCAFICEDDEYCFGDLAEVKELYGSLGYAKEVKEFKANPDKWPGHVGDVSTVIRVAITGRRNTPDLYEILNVLGEQEVKERLKAVL